MSPSINIIPRGKLTLESFEQITICTSFVWTEYSRKMFANLTEYSFICMVLIAQPQYAYEKKNSVSIYLVRCELYDPQHLLMPALERESFETSLSASQLKHMLGMNSDAGEKLESVEAWYLWLLLYYGLCRAANNGRGLVIESCLYITVYQCN